MGALQSRLRMASETHRKFWTRCPEVQLTAGQPSKLGQVAQAFANQILKISEAGDLTASLGTLLQGSGTLIAIFLFLPTSGNFPRYTSGLLPLALLPCICERRLAPSSLYAPTRALKTTIPFPLAFSSPGGTKADLSLHATHPRDARSSSLIAPAAGTPAGCGAGLCWPSGWERSTCVYAISHREVQNCTQTSIAVLSPVFTYRLSAGTLLSLLQSQGQSAGFI